MKGLKKAAVLIVCLALVLSLFSGIALANGSEAAVSSYEAVQTESEDTSQKVGEGQEYHVFFTPSDDVLFSEENKMVYLDLSEIKDLKYEIAVFGVGYFDPSKPKEEQFTELEKGVDYLIQDRKDDNNKIIGKLLILEGSKIYPKVSAAETDRIFLHVDIDTDPAEGETQRIWLCNADAQFRVQDSVEDYDRERDRDMLPGWNGSVQKNYNVYVENPDHPDGEDLQYTVTDVKVLEGAELLEIEKMYENNDETSENYWWDYRIKKDTIRNPFGRVVLEVAYTDLHDKAQTYQFTITSAADIYEVFIDSDSPGYQMLPGTARTFTARVINRHYDQMMDDYSEADVSDNEGLQYQWAIGRNEKEVAVPKSADGRIFEVAARDLLPEEEELFGSFSVDLTVSKDGTEIGKEGIGGVFVSSQYEEISAEGFKDILPGQSLAVPFEVRRYTYGQDSFETLENVHFRWEYDENIVTVRDPEGVIVGNYEGEDYKDSPASTGTTVNFTVERKGTGDAELRLIAEWTEIVADGDESREEHRETWWSYHLNEYDSDIYFEDSVDRVFSDGELVLTLNTKKLEELGDEGYELEFLVGLQEEGSDDFARVFTEGQEYTVDGNQVTLKGAEIWTAVEEKPERIEINAAAKCGESEIGSAHYSIEVREPVVEYRDLQPGEEQNADFIPGWPFKVPAEVTAYVENTEYPYGKELSCKVTGVEITENKEGVLDGEPKEEYEGEKLTGWSFQTKRGVFGTALLTASFIDLQGNPVSGAVRIHTVKDIYNQFLTFKDGVWAALPGDTLEMKLNVEHWTANPDTESGEPAIPASVDASSYTWELPEDWENEFAILTQDETDPSVAYLKFKSNEELADYNTRLWVDLPIKASVALKDGDSEFVRECWNHAAVSNWFWGVLPVDPFPEPIPIGIGKTMTVEVRDYCCLYEGVTPADRYINIQNVTYTWNYDSEQVEISCETGTDPAVGDHCPFTITLKTDRAVATLHVKWTDAWNRVNEETEEYELEGYKVADYRAVEAAKAKVPADLSIYTEESAKAVTDAVAAVVYEKPAEEQEIVDGYAKAIETAVAGLVIIPIFPDVADAENQWFYADVYKAYSTVNAKGNRLIQGYKSGSFGPADDLTRQDFAILMHRLADEPDAVFEGTLFKDVTDPDAYYAMAVMWAKANGVINGYENGAFGVGDPVTREQIATILYNYAVKKLGQEKLQKALDAGDLSAFEDVSSVSSWAATGMKWANGAGIIKGKSAVTLDPTGKASRAEVVTMINRFLDYMNQLQLQ